MGTKNKIKSKKRDSFSFRDIFKATLYFHISDTIISFIIFIIVLLAVIGYFMRKKAIEKEKDGVDDSKTKRNKYIGTILLFIFGILSVIVLLPLILNFFTFFLVDYAFDEIFE